MIDIARDTVVPSVDAVIGILEGYNQLMPIYVDFDKLCQYIGWYQLELDKMAGPLFELLKGVRYRDKLNVLLLSWLRQRGEDMSVFSRTTTGEISLEAKSIEKARQSGKLTGDAIGVINTYQVFMNYTKTRRTLAGLLQFPVVDYYSYDNHRMIAIVPKWSRQNTGRLGMSDPAIQNFPRGVQDLFTVPKGWIYVHTDSGQVEPRITYSAFLPDKQIQSLINGYNDSYYALVHYCTMDKSFIRDMTTNFELWDTEGLKDSRQRIKTYGNSVMYGSKSNVEHDPIKDAMIERIGNHPMRLDLINRIQKQLNRGDFVFKTWFGTPINILNSPKLAGISDMDGEYYQQELVKLAINNPIQGTAADLMRISIGKAYNLLSKKAPNSVILDYVHDAGCFAIHEDDWDKVGDEICDIVAYNVEGWVPIYAEPEIGRDGGSRGLFPDMY